MSIGRRVSRLGYAGPVRGKSPTYWGAPVPAAAPPDAAPRSSLPPRALGAPHCARTTTDAARIYCAPLRSNIWTVPNKTRRRRLPSPPRLASRRESLLPYGLEPPDAPTDHAKRVLLLA